MNGRTRGRVQGCRGPFGTVLLAMAAIVGRAEPAAAAGTPTWTTVTSSANPALVGQTVSFTAIVRAVGGGATPTGTVTFKDAAATIGTGTLDGAGKATFTTAALGLGTHPITAVYGGDSSLAPSASDTLLQAVPSTGACDTPGLYPVPGSPVAGDAAGVAVADFNGDTKPDLVVARRASKDVTVFLGDGTGAFRAGTPVPAAAARAPLVGDFDADGHPDVAVIGHAADVATASLSILLGDGRGGLAPAGTPLTLAATYPPFAAVGEFSLDGKLDLAVAYAPDSSGGRAAILLGDGAGNLSPVGESLDTDVYPSPVAGDLDLDGRLDLAVEAGYESRKVTSFLGNGSGALTVGPATPTGLQSFPGIVAGDFNLDGKLDLAARSYIYDRMAILLGDGAGGFAVRPSFPVTNPLGVAVGDFNLDGKPDLAVGAGGSIAILLGDGAGSFAPAGPRPAGRDPSIGDFNQDGRPDLVVTIIDLAATVSVLLNTCGAPATVTTLTSSPNPSRPGEPVVLTATVLSSSGSGTPTGQVQFRDGTVDLGLPVSLSGSTATFTTFNLSDGRHVLTAVYLGDPAFSGSTSSPLSHTVESRLFVNDATANTASATSLDFTVWLTAASDLAVAVEYTTVDRTAKAGVDYTATSGSLDFNPGEVSKTIAVPIVGWSVPGPSKDLFLTLKNPTSATFVASTAVGTLYYSAPGSLMLYIDDPSIDEGNAGTALLGFAARLSRPSFSAVTVRYATADGTAHAGADYEAMSGTLTFYPGQTAKAVLVRVLGNTVAQADRTLLVSLSDATTVEAAGISIARSQGVGTILDDDPPGAPAPWAQYRLYSPITYEHLYTTDTNEYAVLGTVGWLQEGSAYTMFQDGGSYGGVYAVPLYRLYHAGVRQHHWTTDWYETRVLSAGAWTYEGIPGYVLPTPVTGTVPLYRLALAYPPLHLWTTDANEYQVLTTPQRGWIGEGIIGYVLP